MEIKGIQFLSKSSASLCGTCLLNSNQFNEINKPAEVIILELLACQPIDRNCHGRVRLRGLRNQLVIVKSLRFRQEAVTGGFSLIRGKDGEGFGFFEGMWVE